MVEVSGFSVEVPLETRQGTLRERDNRLRARMCAGYVNKLNNFENHTFQIVLHEASSGIGARD
jgi:hypothetical protein